MQFEYKMIFNFRYDHNKLDDLKQQIVEVLEISHKKNKQIVMLCELFEQCLLMVISMDQGIARLKIRYNEGPKLVQIMGQYITHCLSNT